MPRSEFHYFALVFNLFFIFIYHYVLQNGLAEYPSRIASYQAAAPRLGGNKLNTLASIKAFAESSGILDPSVYPANMALCSVAVLPWLQKALAAREAAIAYHAEIGVALE